MRRIGSLFAVVFTITVTAFSLVFKDNVHANEPPSPSELRDEWKASYSRADAHEDIEYPDDNQPNAARTALGHALFFDPRLSRSGMQSCASCHNPSFSWGDSLAVGVGENLDQLGRRTPTILDSAWAPVLMWDGRAETLEEQALGPIQAGVEMNMPLDLLIERLTGIEGYGPMFEAAFGSATVTPKRIAYSIAAYERTIVSAPAPFDRWIEGDELAISDAAKRGFDLFNGKANCAACHDTWRFTDDSFHDIGLNTEDTGRGTHLPNVLVMRHAFKTPGLRNVDQRAPFMHAGQLPSLRAVVDHYNSGGLSRPSLSQEIFPLGLTDNEVDDIVTFLLTLTSPDKPVTLPVLPR